MKDAKGHGSDPRGTAPGYAGRDKLGRTYTQAIRDHDRFPKQNPTLPNGEDYKTGGSLAVAAAHGIPTDHLAPAPKQRVSTNAGPFKVQSLDTKRAGQPWATQRSFRNNTVAERVALRMAADGNHMRVKVR